MVAGALFGGVPGLIETVGSGGTLAPVAAAQTVAAAGLGRVAGRAVGELVGAAVQFAKDKGEFRGGKQKDRDRDYHRILEERQPSKPQRGRIHREIGKRKNGGNLDADEIREIFDEVMGPEK